MHRRPGFCAAAWLVFLLSAVCSPAAGNRLYVSTEDQFRAGLNDVDVSDLWLTTNITLNPARWETKAQVARTLLINLGGFTLDTSGVYRAVTCFAAPCAITLQQGTVLNSVPPGPPSSDFSTPVPTFIATYANGSLTVRNVDVVSARPTGLWMSSSLVYQPASRPWVGNLSMQCQSATEIIVNWVSLHEPRREFLGRPGPTETGYEQLSNVRMILSQDFVCSSSYTRAVCDDAQQICNFFNTPLPEDTCSPVNLPAKCRPVPVMPDRGPLLPADISGSESDPEENDGQDEREWRLGLGVGLALGLAGAIGLLTTLVLVIRARRKPGATGAAADVDSMKTRAGIVKEGLTLEPSSSSAQALHDLERSRGSDAAASKEVVLSVFKYAPTAPDSTTTTQTYPTAHSATEDTHSQLAQQADVNLATPVSEQQHVVSDQTSASNKPSSQAGVTAVVHSSTSHHEPVASHSVTSTSVIDLAPAQPAEPYQAQLSRNPLGVTLQTLLGTGAYGTVYAGLWQGQPAAIKSTEASLGAELQHPRIVRSLAHALVIPEGMVDEAGRLARPGTVESHLVSFLCDLGTLKGWLQQVEQMHSSPSSTLASLHGGSQPSNTAVHLESPRTSTAASSHAASANPSLRTAILSRGACRGDQQETEQCGASTPTTRTQPEVLFMVSGMHDASMQQQHGATVGQQTRCSDSSATTIKVQQLLRSDSQRLGSQGSAKQGQHDVSPATFYPPLACMPVWGTTGLQLHSEAHCHLLAVLDCLLEVADGLRYLLSRGVVHGDLKPQNCLLCSDPADKIRGFTVKIGDFGISRVLHDTKSHTSVTQPPGTLVYFAPELLSTGRLSPACDLYSFGIIMFELLTCKQPLASLSMAQVLYKKATGKVDEFLVYPVEAPQEYVKLARACYSLEASSRPSLHEVLGRLAALREHVVQTSQAAAIAELEQEHGVTC